MAVANSQFKQYIKLSVSEGSNQCSPLVFWGFVFPRVHIFLWLLSNNKILTRMNLAKRQHVEDKTCLFCSEQETVGHLFFDCCVAKVLWAHLYLSDIFQITLGVDYESVARWWVSNKKYKIMNSFATALMWCLWKFQNEMCFQGKIWSGEKLLLGKLLNMLKYWRILFTGGDLDTLDQALSSLSVKLAHPLGLPYPSQNLPIQRACLARLHRLRLRLL